MSTISTIIGDTEYIIDFYDSPVICAHLSNMKKVKIKNLNSGVTPTRRVGRQKPGWCKRLFKLKL